MYPLADRAVLQISLPPFTLMKTKLLILAAAALALASCADLAGVSLVFDEDGTATFHAPPRPVVTPTK